MLVFIFNFCCSSFLVGSGSYAAAFEAPDENGILHIKPKRSLTSRMVEELEQAETLLQGRELPRELDRLFGLSCCDIQDATGKAKGSNEASEPLSKRAKVDKHEGVSVLPFSDCVRIIVLCNDGSDGLIYPLDRNLVVFGRDSSCDVCIGRKTVSGKHAQLRRGRDGYWTLQHVGHGNPTFLNGRCILYSPKPIKHGDIFTISKRRFRFETFAHSLNS